METEGDDLLPHSDEAEGLLAHLAALVTARGPGPLVSNAILEPESRYFPDDFTPAPAGVRALARRLLGYAGLGNLAAGWAEKRARARRVSK